MYELKIGEIAQLGGVSEVTLRYYDRKGLLKPIRTDESTGYRYYSVWQVMQLSFLQYMRSLGFSVEEISELIETDSVNALQQAMQKRKEEIDRELRSLTHQRSILSHILEEYDTFHGHPPFGTTFLVSFPSRYVYAYEVDMGFDEESYIRNYEQSIVNMMHEMAERGIESDGYVNIGSIINHEDAAAGRLAYAYVYVEVNQRFAGQPDVVFAPERVYLCNLCDDPTMELTYMKMLYKECEQRGMAAGEYLREEMIFYPPRMRGGVRHHLYLQAVPVTLHKL